MLEKFTLNSIDGSARSGTISTVHGDIQTPVFMPVATQGSVKSLDSEDLLRVGTQIILSNTYHLYLRPGVEIIKELGGLQKFMHWEGPVLTDSGGFQGFSLEHLRKITDDSIVFKSHIDGGTHTFTPESVIQYQESLGSDIIMPLDVCLSSDSDKEAVKHAEEVTARWAQRSLNVFSNTDQSLFGIIQGGLFPDVRERSIDSLTSMEFSGYAIGGLSVGESKSEMYKIVRHTAGLLPHDSPRYLMGVGSPVDLLECVALGIDMFDCVLPTRIARNGTLFAAHGRVNIDNSMFKSMDSSIDDGCDCYTCKNFSVAYLRHLFKSRELLAYRLATIHNLRFILRLMSEIRQAINQGTFESYKNMFLGRFRPTDQDVRFDQKKKWALSRKTRKI